MSRRQKPHHRRPGFGIQRCQRPTTCEQRPLQIVRTGLALRFEQPHRQHALDTDHRGRRPGAFAGNQHIDKVSQM